LPLFPNHQQYVEPFFGGGAVFFAKKPSPHEVINDTLDCAITFYRVLKTRFPELQSMIQATLHSESEYKRAKELLASEDDLLKAWAFWVNTSMGFSHIIGSGLRFCNDKRDVIYVKNKRDNFKVNYSKRLERTEIFCRDALEIIKLKDTLYDG
jgi:DNA adenine methylase